MQRLSIGFIAFCCVLAASLGAFLFVSIWPYIGLIGKVAAGVVIVCLVCAGALAIAFTWSKIGTLLLRRNTIAYNEYLVYREPDSTFTHLSGIHHQMALPPPGTVTVTEDEDPHRKLDALDPRTQKILDAHKNGESNRQIGIALGIDRRKVAQILHEWGQN